MGGTARDEGAMGEGAKRREGRVGDGDSTSPQGNSQSRASVPSSRPQATRSRATFPLPAQAVPGEPGQARLVCYQGARGRHGTRRGSTGAFVSRRSPASCIRCCPLPPRRPHSPASLIISSTSESDSFSPKFVMTCRSSAAEMKPAGVCEGGWGKVGASVRDAGGLFFFLGQEKRRFER